MANFVTSSTLSKTIAKSSVLALFDIIIPFGQELLTKKPTHTRHNSIQELTKVRDSVKNDIPLRFSSVLDIQFTNFINQLIKFRPSIAIQLKNFWDAQTKIMDISAKQNKDYNPAKYASENVETIMTVNSRYTKVANTFSQNLDDEVLLYSLFYVHILRVESIEYSFVSDFKETLRNFGLENKIDADKIFSVKNKVQKGWGKNKKTGKKQKEWRTDGRAIRDCLGHNLYDLDFTKKPWKIKFRGTKKGFEYTASFNRDSFIQLMNSFDLLYRTCLMLLFTIFTLTLCKQHFL